MTYQERLGKIAVTQLKTEGFEKLKAKQKLLAFYLAEAGLWGRYISVDQGSHVNIGMFKSMIALKNAVGVDSNAYTEFKDSLFMLFAHNGIYESTTGQKLVLPMTKETVEAIESKSEEVQQAKAYVLENWFGGKIKEWRTVQKDGVDVVAESGGNFYANLTTKEVVEWRKKNYPVVEGEKVPPFGFNERLVKHENGTITVEKISATGLYAPYVKKIIENLQKALEYTENEAQYASIKSLIKCYETGDAFDFDEHCVAWVKDQSSDVYFINGMIECYEDPLGIGCTFESIVAFKNPLQTAKVKKIIDNIQWFENKMPFEDRFKKEKAQGLSASSITVVSMAGETAPTLPLGINLPNNDWIRKEHGSKSVNLENSASSRSGFEKALREAMYLPKYMPIINKYLNVTNGLHTDLHEIAGHGSGKVLPGVNTDVIGPFYSIIEECRADLVALYFMADKKLRQYGIFDKDVDVKKAARAQYVGYLTNGTFAQLRRIEEGQDLTQAHFRNRQIIANWVLKNGGKRAASIVEKDGLPYVEVKDLKKVRHLFGKLLKKIQKIKSTGDFEAARQLVVTYGTKVNQDMWKSTQKRIAGLDMPQTVCFLTPVLKKIGDDVELVQVDNFLKQQEELFNKYCMLV